VPLEPEALPEEYEHPVVPPETERVAESASLPPEVVEGREERRVIVEQWIEFMSISMETDPQMLTMQGQAFLRTLVGINERLLDTLPREANLEELELQWQDSESMGEALADAFDSHRSRHNDSPDWRAMQSAVSRLARQLLKHRNDLRARIVAAGAQVPER
jgi:hypothetical protein